MNKIFEASLRQDSLSSAFRKLTARNSSIIPVVEDQRLIGIATLQNLMHSMALLAESRNSSATKPNRTRRFFDVQAAALGLPIESRSIL